MLAVRLHAKGDLRVETVAPPPPPGPGEVSLAVTAAGICGSDLHNFLTGAWITRAPSIAGHEFTGIVSAIGPDVTHVRPGVRVIVDSRYTCGRCPACAEGLAQVCETLGFLGEAIDGGFAEAVTLPARNVLPAPPGVADRHLAMAEPLAVALHALDRLGASEGAEIVVAGCGPIGAFLTLLARERGHPVLIFDRNGARAAHVARETGAGVTDLGALSGRRFRHCADTTGNAQVIAGLLERIAGAGRMALVGIGAPAGIVDPVHLVEREIALIGCHAYGDELERIGRMLPDLAPRLDAFIADTIPLDEVPERYERLIAGRVAGIKTIVRGTSSRERVTRVAGASRTEDPG